MPTTFTPGSHALGSLLTSPDPETATAPRITDETVATASTAARPATPRQTSSETGGAFGGRENANEHPPSNSKTTTQRIAVTVARNAENAKPRFCGAGLRNN